MRKEKKQKLHLFLVSWVIYSVFAAIAVLGTAAYDVRGDTPFTEYVWFFLITAVFIGLHGAVIVHLLSYRRELGELRELRDFFGEEIDQPTFQQMALGAVSRRAVRTRDAEFAETALYVNGVLPMDRVKQGKEIEVFQEKAQRLRYDSAAAKRAFENCWDRMVRVSNRIYPSIGLGARLWSNHAPAVQKEEKAS